MPYVQRYLLTHYGQVVLGRPRPCSWPAPSVPKLKAVTTMVLLTYVWISVLVHSVNLSLPDLLLLNLSLIPSAVAVASQ